MDKITLLATIKEFISKNKSRDFPTVLTFYDKRVLPVWKDISNLYYTIEDPSSKNGCLCSSTSLITLVTQINIKKFYTIALIEEGKSHIVFISPDKLGVRNKTWTTADIVHQDLAQIVRTFNSLSDVANGFAKYKTLEIKENKGTLRFVASISYAR